MLLLLSISGAEEGFWIGLLLFILFCFMGIGLIIWALKIAYTREGATKTEKIMLFICLLVYSVLFLGLVFIGASYSDYAAIIISILIAFLIAINQDISGRRSSIQVEEYISNKTMKIEKKMMPMHDLQQRFEMLQNDISEINDMQKEILKRNVKKRLTKKRNTLRNYR
ncbi:MULTISPECIES: hypothetical protein [Bacillus cereus group]|nr:MULTISPECIES: hypothetical protein [Bacillus cereus group]OUB48617.1 hypothetical protein BK740_06190 [Bacillus thuringiensis serovar argentinensis]PEB67024.1 hypothetical protein COM91_25680 [Bacillus thuringiensis]PFD31270.1 hypothetical protein CN278_25000 [Bacillus thuringiensis]PFN18764.1 hypothetical protein COJ69_25130 [Bacillus cereus]PGF20988.1 hypothetical protein CON27_16920 [Bacillus thuringiensis]